MKTIPKHPFRAAFRLFWLAGEFALAAVNYAKRCAFCTGDSLALARADWLQATSRRFLRVFGVRSEVRGTIPPAGLLVCNHLSYLDIIVLGSLAPAVFVAKHDVTSWPVFGWFARLAGTVFVQRERRMQVGKKADEIQARLAQGLLVILFPEGTSSGGETVLPFKSSLLQPATTGRYALSVGLIGYELEDGDVAKEVCYWKDMTFFPHLVNLLGERWIGASVRFAEVRQEHADRKVLARQLHSEVLRLKASICIQSKDECKQQTRLSLESI